MTTEPPLRTYARPELAPQTALVFASLGAATLIAAYGFTSGITELVAAGSIALVGPLVGLAHIDEQAHELEGSDV